jgi:hypothetical protein
LAVRLVDVKLARQNAIESMQLVVDNLNAFVARIEQVRRRL